MTDPEAQIRELLKNASPEEAIMYSQIAERHAQEISREAIADRAEAAAKSIEAGFFATQLFDLAAENVAPEDFTLEVCEDLTRVCSFLELVADIDCGSKLEAIAKQATDDVTRKSMRVERGKHLCDRIERSIRHISDATKRDEQQDQLEDFQQRLDDAEKDLAKANERKAALFEMTQTHLSPDWFRHSQALAMLNPVNSNENDAVDKQTLLHEFIREKKKGEVFTHAHLRDWLEPRVGKRVHRTYYTTTLRDWKTAGWIDEGKTPSPSGRGQVIAFTMTVDGEELRRDTKVAVDRLDRAARLSLWTDVVSEFHAREKSEETSN